MQSLIKKQWSQQGQPINTRALVEFCVISGVSAAMTLEAKQNFDDWMSDKRMLQAYPKDRTVSYSTLSITSLPEHTK